MKRLWNWIDTKNFTKESKIGVFLSLNCILYGLIGFVIWLMVRNVAFDTWESALCFVGYPSVFVGFLGGYFFLCRQ